MKPFFLLLLTGLLGNGHLTKAQRVDSLQIAIKASTKEIDWALRYGNVLKVNVTSPRVQTYSLAYEHPFSSQGGQVTWQVEALWTNRQVGSTQLAGFAITPELRWYWGADNGASIVSNRYIPDGGTYWAPFVRYQHIKLNTSYTAPTGLGQAATASLNTVGGGLLFGYQRLIKLPLLPLPLVIDAFVGPSYNAGPLRVLSGDKDAPFEAGRFRGFSWRAGINVGVAF